MRPIDPTNSPITNKITQKPSNYPKRKTELDKIADKVNKRVLPIVSSTDEYLTSEGTGKGIDTPRPSNPQKKLKPGENTTISTEKNEKERIQEKHEKLYNDPKISKRDREAIKKESDEFLKKYDTRQERVKKNKEVIKEGQQRTLERAQKRENQQSFDSEEAELPTKMKPIPISPTSSTSSSERGTPSETSKKVNAFFRAISPALAGVLSRISPNPFTRSAMKISPTEENSPEDKNLI
jgi:hypothetical protein